MKIVKAILLSVLLLLPCQMFAETVTFPGSGLSFTENNHSFSFSGNGQIISNSYRSASYCAMLNSNYGASWYLTKVGGNKFQLNNLWIYNLQDYSYSIQFKGYDGSTEKYSKDVTIPTEGYSQVTFSGWTDITKIQGISPTASTGWACDDINYTVNNTAPTNITLDNSAVDDGAPSGTTVGTFTTTDTDDNGAHTYTFATGGADNGSFTIDGALLKTAFVADYDTKNSYTVKIRSTDTGSLWYEKDLAITVNPAAPSQYIVTSAENSDYNGTYVRNGSYNGYPMYTNGSYYLANRGCVVTWSIACDDPEVCPGYSTDASSSLPPSSDWSQDRLGSSSNISVTDGDGSLPVELSDLTAVSERGTILIKWNTQSETGHLGFIVQRAQIQQNEKLTWCDIAGYKHDQSLKGTGDTTNKREYQYRDKNVEKDQQYSYRLISVALDGSREYSYSINVTNNSSIPKDFSLHPAYPNPFNPATTLNFDIAEPCYVEIYVTNVTGKYVRTLMYQASPAGQHTVQWDGLDHQGVRSASGVYFIIMKTSQNHYFTQKVLMLK